MGSKNPIIVMGVSGCGKTTVGRALAERLNSIFLDADDFHPEANVAKMRAGTPLNDDDRAPWLVMLNHELQARSVRGEQVVLACSALKKNYRAAISVGLTQARWIFLDGSFELIASRMRKRPSHYMPDWPQAHFACAGIIAANVASIEAYAAFWAHPNGLKIRSIDAENLPSLFAGRRGQTTSSPPQFGQTFSNFTAAQSAQNVHSNAEMRASVDSFGRSQLQHLQLGRNASMA